jgi:hypothetical protein
MTPERRTELIARVERLVRALDVPIDGLPGAAAAAVGLGMRAGDLYESIRHAGSADGTAATILVRPIVEIAIVIRWIERDPNTRVRLWLAEDDRQRLLLEERVVEMHRRRGATLGPVLDPPIRAAIQREIDQVRALTSRRRGPLLPSLEEMMADAAPDLWEAYEVAFRATSPAVHSAPRSMTNDRLEHRPDGMHLVPGTAWDPRSTEELATAVLCAVIEAVSRLARLPHEAVAREIRAELAAWGLPPAGGGERQAGE